jgi:hypothetical protein
MPVDALSNVLWVAAMEYKLKKKEVQMNAQDGKAVTAKDLDDADEAAAEQYLRNTLRSIR